jgi:hypothetical protein
MRENEPQLSSEQAPDDTPPLQTTKESRHDRRMESTKKFEGSYWDTKQPPEEAPDRPYAVKFNSQTVNPYTQEEIQHMLDHHAPGDLFKVDPARVRTMHAGIADAFSDGLRIEDTARQLKDDPASARHLPPIKVAAVELPQGRGQTDTQLYTEDHRRVVAAREAGLGQLNAQIKAEPSVLGNYTTQNEGLSVEVRKYHNTGEGRHQGGNASTFPAHGSVYRYGVEDDAAPPQRTQRSSTTTSSAATLPQQRADRQDRSTQEDAPARPQRRTGTAERQVLQVDPLARKPKGHGR